MKVPHILQSIIVCLLLMISLLTIENTGAQNAGRQYAESRMQKAAHGIRLTEHETEWGMEARDRRPERAFRDPCSVNREPFSPTPNPQLPNSEDGIPSAAFIYELGKAALRGREGSMRQETMLGIAGLEREETPPLSTGMVNVTGTHNAYRMLPAGMVFNNDITVVLPYDSALLPLGYRPEDIMTYYYDVRHKRWIAIERDTVDVENKLVVSRVDHFTDFINAIIQTPEMPETEAYLPTTMSDIQAANPLANMPLMQPPSANNSGTANLQYPIEVPAGRQGMQPSLAVTYSSGGGNGWLGVGWDISVPAITVETRWGVPRYNTSKESEVYLYNGEQLVTKGSDGKFNPMPHRTNTWSSRKPDGTQFYPRKEEAFDSIVRHENSPSSYWWSVTDRNGITNYYGKSKTSEAMDPNAVLQDGNGNIAHWALTETRDPYGNSVHYYYSIVMHPGEANSNVYGKQIYLDSIRYTGHYSDPGKYNVIFHRNTAEREDVIIRGNYGFKEVSAHLLCNIQVNFENNVITRYAFVTENKKESMYKTRLTDILRLDFVNTTNWYGEILPTDPFVCLSGTEEEIPYKKYVRTHFDYYDRPEAEQLFGNAVSMSNLDDDGISSFFLSGGFNNVVGKSTALGSTKGKSWSVGGTAAVGLGPNVCMTSISVGGNYSYSESSSEGMLTMIDLDGDGLADKVYKKDGVVLYRKQISTGETSFRFGDDHILTGVSDFLKESSNTNDWGLQASAGLSLSGAWPGSKSTTNVYFADVNADGLPDLIVDNDVLFNSLENGVPTFTPFSRMIADPVDPEVPEFVMTSATAPCGGIIFDGEVNDSVNCRVERQWYAHFDTPFRNIDSVRQVYADSSLYEIEYERHYETLDTGVHVWYDSLVVTIYKKVLICDAIAPDPNLDAVKVWIAPKSGSVTVYSEINLLEDTSTRRTQSHFANGIRYSVQLDRNLHFDFDIGTLNSDSAMELHSNVIGGDDYETYVWSSSFHVNEGDALFFRLQSDDDHSFDKVKWYQGIVYSGSSGNDLYGKNANIYTSNEDFVVTGKEYFQAPANGHAEVSVDVSVLQNLNRKAILYMEHNGNREELILNYAGDYQFGTALYVRQYDSIKFILESEAPRTYYDENQTTWGDIVVRPRIDYTPTISGVEETFHIYPPVNMHITNKINFRHISNILDLWSFIECLFDNYYKSSLFGPLYRGWGQFVHNNNYEGAAITDLIDVTQLKLNSLFSQERASDVDTAAISAVPDCGDYSQEAMSAGFDDAGMYYPLTNTSRWVEMRPNSYRQAWVGYGNLNWIMRDTTSNTRMLEWMRDGLIDIEENDGSASDIVVYDHPVPQPTADMPVVKTVRKQNESKLKNYSSSLSIVPVISTGISKSEGENKIITDYMDLNGDRYPDIMGEARVHYTMPWGGIGEMADLEIGVAGLTRSETSSDGTTFGASYCIPKRGSGNNPKSSKISFDGQGSLSANFGNGNDETDYTWLDINGDGLPDKLSKSGMAALNMGYYFLPFSIWNQGSARIGTSANDGLGFGGSFNMGQASVGGGMSVNSSENESASMLMDFNGDGLPDKVKKSGNSLNVSYNKGNGTWTVPENIPIPHLSHGISYSESANGSFTLGFTFFGFLKITVGVQGAPYNRTFSKDRAQWVDINGDGHLDYVTSEGENDIKVRYNQTGKTNLLKKVTNFTRTTIELDYEMPPSSYEQPQRSWQLSEVKTNDPYTPAGGAATLTRFEYGGDNYNRYERFAYGLDTVVTKQYDTENGNQLYRVTTEVYNNKSFLKRGKKMYDILRDGNGNPYVETLYDVSLVDMNSGEVVGEEDCPAEAFPIIEVVIKNYYEGNSTPGITTMQRFAYDKKRNVKSYRNYGDTAILDDDIRGEIIYMTGMGNNLISLPAQITVCNHTGSAILRKRNAVYNNQGRTTKITQYNGATAHETLLEYDIHGNVSKLIAPPNLNNQRMHHQYAYDSVIHTYPVRVENALGLHSTAEYCYIHGKPVKTIDVNGQEMRYKYDRLGRLDTIIGPNELTIDSLWTIHMRYEPTNYGQDGERLTAMLPTRPEIAYSYARTYHYDSQHPGNPMMTTVVCDGWGRILQTKKDAEINGVECSAVSGKVVYDAFGRAVKQYHPFEEPVDTSFIYDFIVFNDIYNPATETAMLYDVMDRQTRITLPDGSITTMAYGFGNDAFGVLRFKTLTTDANSNSMETYTDYRQLQTSIKAPLNTVTKFVYNPLGELLASIDPEGLETNYEYDNLGRMTRRKHPDAHNDYYVYDKAGNLTAKQTGNLKIDGEAILYDYFYNLPTAVHYPHNPQNNVLYYYGAPSGAPNGYPAPPNATPNSVGRLAFVEDAAGFTTFSYGKLGEVTEEYRTFVLPEESESFTFRTGFEYDSWNRLRTMIYPDYEKVKYHYDKGGQLSRINSYKNGDTMTYIENITYNKFGQRDAIYYGNGTYALYSYDILQRLIGLQSYDANNEMMQDIDYVFDPVGNITDVTNYAVALQNGLGGEYDYHYAYDDLYRLIRSTGVGENNTYYNVDMAYTPNGKIEQKNVGGRKYIQGANNSINYQKTYTYRSNTNKLKEVLSSDTRYFVWDFSGNLLADIWKNGRGQYLCWDEENRIKIARNGKQYARYTYDANGERVFKVTGEDHNMVVNGAPFNHATLHDPTLYASPYVVATPRGYTKHYYAGAERIASRIGGGGLKDIDHWFGGIEDKKNKNLYFAEIGCLECATEAPDNQKIIDEYGREKPKEIMARFWNEYYTGYDILYDTELDRLHRFKSVIDDEKFAYWYHPDHLGSSSWITDQDGEAIQHLQYLPFGEQYIDQRTTGWDAMFTFSGKERDAETGYSYFGARYYDSDISIWLSVDPLASKYPSLSPYVYCANNPVKLVDPDGRDIITVDENGRTSIKKANGYDILISKKTGEKQQLSGNGVFRKALSETKDADGNVTRTALKGMSKEDGENTFKFMADNTNVEIGLINTEKHGSTVVTDHEKNSVKASGYASLLDSKGQAVTDVIHSHTNNTGPSGFTYGDISGDKFAAQNLVTSHGNTVNYYVYQSKKDNLIKYDQRSILGSMTWGNPSSYKSFARQSFYPGKGLPPH